MWSRAAWTDAGWRDARYARAPRPDLPTQDQPPGATSLKAHPLTGAINVPSAPTLERPLAEQKPPPAQSG
jgi:hypothetical protein